jgi:hypothetical protein
MDIYPDSDVAATWLVETDVDLATATVEVEVDGAWHPGTWVGSTVVAGTKWRRTARAQFRGVDAVSGSIEVLRSQQPSVKVNVGSESRIVGSTERIVVKSYD